MGEDEEDWVRVRVGGITPAGILMATHRAPPACVAPGRGVGATGSATAVSSGGAGGAWAWAWAWAWASAWA